MRPTVCRPAVEAATPQALADLLQSSGRYTNGTPWPASRQMDNGRGDGTTTRCVQELIRNIQTCAANSQTSMRAANFQTLYAVTSRPRRALPTSRPNYYLSHRARECDDADVARCQLPDHDVCRQRPDLIYQTLFVLYHAGPAGMTTPTTEGAHADRYCL